MPNVYVTNSFSIFFQPQNDFLLSHRQFSDLHFSLFFFKTNAVLTVKTEGKNQEFIISLSNVYHLNRTLTGHTWVTRNTWQSHVPILLLT